MSGYDAILDNVVQALGTIALAASAIGVVALFSLVPAMLQELRDFLDQWL